MEEYNVEGKTNIHIFYKESFERMPKNKSL